MLYWRLFYVYFNHRSTSWPETPDSDRQGKEMQGWEIRSRQVPMEANQLPHELPSLSSAVGGGDKANPRAAFCLVLFLDTNMSFIRNSQGVYWFGKSQHNSRRLIRLPSGKSQWCLPASHSLGQPGSEQHVPSQWPPFLSCYSNKYIKLLSLEDPYLWQITRGIP